MCVCMRMKLTVRFDIWMFYQSRRGSSGLLHFVLFFLFSVGLHLSAKEWRFIPWTKKIMEAVTFEMVWMKNSSGKGCRWMENETDGNG